MSRICAAPVIGQRGHDAALIDIAPSASVEHPLEFTFEGAKPLQSLFDIDEVLAGDRVDFGAGTAGLILQGDEFTNRVDGKPEIARVPDQSNSVPRCGVVCPLTTYSAVRLI